MSIRQKLRYGSVFIGLHCADLISPEIVDSHDHKSRTVLRRSRQNWAGGSGNYQSNGSREQTNPDCVARKIMKLKIACLPKLGLVAAAAIFLHQSAYAVPINLRTAADFAILDRAAVAFAPGTTKVTGKIGVSPGRSITGIPKSLTLPGSSAIHNKDGVAAHAKLHLNFAAASASVTATLANIFGRKTLFAGVYDYATPTDSTILTGALKLSGTGLIPDTTQSHAVPDSGSMLLLVGSAMATLLGLKRRFRSLV